MPDQPRPSVPAHIREDIPGWGADLDPADRPAVPREQHLPTGAHWEVPDRQQSSGARERSLEHAMVPPVFGDTIPLKGLSGAIRGLAYRNFSEARAAHWLLLMAGDRVDTVEAHVRSLLTTRPANPLTQTAVAAEVGRAPLRSRLQTSRVDARHHWLDPVIVAGPWVLSAVGGYAAARAVARRLRGIS